MCKWKLFTNWNKRSFIFHLILILRLIKYFGPIFVQLIIGTVILIFQLSVNYLLFFRLLICFCCWNKLSLRNNKYIIYCQNFRNRFFTISNILNEYRQHLLRITLSKLHSSIISCVGINMRYFLVLCLQPKLNII